MNRDTHKLTTTPAEPNFPNLNQQLVALNPQPINPSSSNPSGTLQPYQEFPEEINHDANPQDENNQKWHEHLKKQKDSYEECKKQMDKLEANVKNFKSQNLPLARIKKIMKTDEDVRMISADAPI